MTRLHSSLKRLLVGAGLALGGLAAVSGPLTAAHADVFGNPPTTSATAKDQLATGQFAQTGTTSTGHGVRLTVSSGTSADYHARERLAFFSFPTDAVGTTTAVRGGIVLDANGRIVPAQSQFVIDLRTLKSDRSQRDQYIQANTLQTARYPQAAFSVERAVGLPAVLPNSGMLHFTLVGNLTVHGVKRSTTWAVTATLGSRSVTGVATTRVTLTAFGMTPPQVGFVLGVNDTLTLDINARLARTPL
jgi:polyisoprenoid-binding protein YceI